MIRHPDTPGATPVSPTGVALAWACLGTARVLLGLLPLARIESLFQLFGPQDHRGAPRTFRRALRAAVAVRRAVSLPPRNLRCLERSLALRILLALSGVASELRIGVRRVPSGIEAHAWVLCHGQPIGEPVDPATTFRPLRTTERPA